MHSATALRQRAHEASERLERARTQQFAWDTQTCYTQVIQKLQAAVPEAAEAGKDALHLRFDCQRGPESDRINDATLARLQQHELTQLFPECSVKLIPFHTVAVRWGPDATNKEWQILRLTF